MKTIKLTQTQVFNGMAYKPHIEHNVSDSIAETAARRGKLAEPARDYVAPVEVPEVAPTEAVTVEAPTEPEAKTKRK